MLLKNRRKYFWLVLACSLMIGCADAYRKDSQQGSEQESRGRLGPAESDSLESKSADETESRNGRTSGAGDDRARPSAIERVYGDIHLEDYSDITVDWIEHHLKPQTG